MPSSKDLSQLTQKLQLQWEESMRQWWTQSMENPTFLQAMGENIAAMAQAEQEVEETAEEQLRRLHLPSRKDLARLSSSHALLEEQIFKQNDRIQELEEQLKNLEQELIQTRIETTNSQIEALEKIQRFQTQLDHLTSRLEQKNPFHGFSR